MAYIIGLLLVAAALYVAFKAYTDTGFNWRKGVAALAALIGGLIVMAGDWLSHLVK